MAIIIEIEGTDGSGKQTQSTMLFNALKQTGLKCCLHSFPSYGSLSAGPVTMYLGGEFGDTASCLNAYQASALYAVDRLCTMKKLKKENYDVIVLDRYTGSNMIHQACKTTSELERDKCLAWIDNFEYNNLSLPRPNMVIFLDMPVEKSIEMARARKSLKVNAKQDIHEKDTNHLIHAYKTGKYVCEKFNWINVCCVDENKNIRTIEDIHFEVLNKVYKLIEKLTKKT